MLHWLIAIRLVQQPEEIKQCALAAARGSDDRVDLPAMRLKGHALEHMHPALPLPEIAVEVGAAQREIRAARSREQGGGSRVHEDEGSKEQGAGKA